MSAKRTPSSSPRRSPKKSARKRREKTPLAASASHFGQTPVQPGEVPRVRGAGARRMGAGTGVPLAAAAAISVASPQRVRMIILPRSGLRAAATGLESSTVNALFALKNGVGQEVRLANIASNIGLAAASPSLAGNTTLKVIDSIAENGAKLIEMDPGDEAVVRASLPGLRLVPEVFYEPFSLRLSLESNLQPAGTGSTVKVTVKSSKGGAALRGVRVLGFSNFATRVGAEGFTDAKGVATLDFAVKPSAIERLYVFAERGFWSGLRLSVPTSRPIAMSLDPIDLTLAVPDMLRAIYGNADLSLGSGVKVGVIDTGCGPHPSLQIAGGFNAVTGQNAGDFGDNGDLHGTHVAGIIAARGGAPTGVRGLAPSVSLFSYRVFPKGANASNFDIAKAIDRARLDGCDLINLSLGRPANAGEGADEPLVRFALEDVREAGTLPIAAAGNDGRAGVSFPGADELCMAVSALGNRKTMPATSVSAAAFAPPPGADPDDFVADFSNVGPEIDLMGPGVGIVSTVPAKDFAVMDGTSMASPAVTGAVARLLAARSDILGLLRNGARSAAIAQLAVQAASTRGFAPQFEGNGLVM
jgi:subtilisin family serine protease